MRALIVQHEPDGPAGLIGEHLERRGYDLEVLQVMEPGSSHSSIAFPDPTTFEAIVSLGSTLSAYDDQAVGSWFPREVEMLRLAHESGVPIFGICFGAQAMTVALGGHVEAAPSAEIGWVEIETDVPESIAAGPWCTWHGDRCVLPADVVDIARNGLCTQAFRVGATVGVQFHPEITEDKAREWAGGLDESYFVSRGASRDALLAGFGIWGAAARARATTLFDWFVDEVTR